MRDEEVFSFSIPFFHFQCPALNWNSVSLQYCLCRFWKLWNWGSNNFPRTIVDWYTGFNFSFNFCRIYFLTPIFWRLTLANQIGFCTEKYASKPSVLFGNHLLAICCAYLIICSSTCLGLGLRWLGIEANFYSEAIFAPKRSIRCWMWSVIAGNSPNITFALI